ncbi:hypothetical protein V492_03203 [Pseudogymnoascus sp. VKM F-4246]|nr:hypothetical protein V492_03203 [Pseudogymnoascus sp. VKM F-4246]
MIAPFDAESAPQPSAPRNSHSDSPSMASTQSGGHGNGRDVGSHAGYRGRHSNRHSTGRDDGCGVKRRRRSNHAIREETEGDGTEIQPNELNGEEITRSDRPITPTLATQQIQYIEEYGVPEGGPGNGWAYAGQNEPFPGDGDPENVLSYNYQPEPISGAQTQRNNGISPDGQLIGLDGLPQYSPFDTWEDNISKEYNPRSDFLFRFSPHGG